MHGPSSYRIGRTLQLAHSRLAQTGCHRCSLQGDGGHQATGAAQITICSLGHSELCLAGTPALTDVHQSQLGSPPSDARAVAAQGNGNSVCRFLPGPDTGPVATILHGRA